MSINDKNSSLNNFRTQNKNFVGKMKERSQSTCQLLCFKRCNETPEEEAQINYIPHLKISKLSLKRMGEQ